MTALLLLFAWFVWPTPWEYGVEYWERPVLGRDNKPARERRQVQVRTHRITGEKQTYAGPEGGWGHFVVW